ncbi:MAG: allantoinase AllB [Calditrichia bacterium]
MNNTPIRKLSNALIPAGENRVRLVDIHFDDRIRQIVEKLNAPIEWGVIRDRESWMAFKRENNVPEPSAGPGEDSAGGWLLIPGAVDSHVHFNTPGFEDREDFEHGSLAAVHGGVTTVIDMPCTSLPPVTTSENLQRKAAALENRSFADYVFWGGVRGNDFREGRDIGNQIRELAGAGVAGFKTYLISGMETFGDLTPEEMRQAAGWIRKTGLPMAVHAEDRNLVLSRRSRLQAENRRDWRAYCQARDNLAESTAVETVIRIARETGVRLHIVHLSSKEGLEKVRAAQQDGLPVTAETCPHYLHFTQKDFENPRISAFLKTAPPVKTEADREALWEGLRNGSLLFVTTDHAGCNPEREKSSPDFWQVYGGIPGVEHRVPFLFSEGFLKNRLSLQQSVDLLSANAARYFGLYPQKGSLQIGSDADFALLNLWESVTVKAREMHSKGKYTPFEGITFNARVERTWLRGKVVAQAAGKAEAVSGFGQRIRIRINH